MSLIIFAVDNFLLNDLLLKFLLGRKRFLCNSEKETKGNSKYLVKRKLRTMHGSGYAQSNATKPALV